VATGPLDRGDLPGRFCLASLTDVEASMQAAAAAAQPFAHTAGEARAVFLERIADPEANWKFQSGDVRERDHWDAYMDAYQDALNETSRLWAPWYAIPADDKRFMRRAVSEILVETMAAMDLEYPKLPEAERTAMAEAKKKLQKE
jgi:hypothetical protein